MGESIKMRLAEAGLEGGAEAKLVNQLLSKIHGLLEKLGASLHEQMDVEDAIGNDVLIEIVFWFLAFHFLPPFSLFNLDLFGVSVVDVSGQLRRMPPFPPPFLGEIGFEGEVALGNR